jgi:hypothetical protein
MWFQIWKINGAIKSYIQRITNLWPKPHRYKIPRYIWFRSTETRFLNIKSHFMNFSKNQRNFVKTEI